jgi:hypothetical protein
MSPGAVIPPPGVVQDALRKTTERLAQELGGPTESTPSWSDFEWRGARAAAAMHGVAPLLASSLRWHGPSGWRTFLAEQRDQTESRQRHIETLSTLLGDRAREAGIPLVALKGAALHALGLYAPGERPMTDLDFLVEEPDLAAATRLLEDRSHSKDQLPGNQIRVQWHRRIREKLSREPTDISEFVFPARPHPGLNRYPSRAALLMHLALHAAAAMANRELRLIHLHDLALVCKEMDTGEWEEILRQGESGGHGPWWFLPPLQMAGRYFPDIVPDGALSSLQRSCPVRLRRLTARRVLTDVSPSSVWIHAFPGLEWSRSAAERVRYMLDLSQKSHVLRWITSRPTRNSTMYGIREALAQPH